MAERPDNGTCAQATRVEIAEGARRHYADVSLQAQHWMSNIPNAIDAWEREPALVDALKKLVVAVGEVIVVTDSMCEFCGNHALKHYGTGEILGPVPHDADCEWANAKRLIAEAERTTAHVG